MVNIMLEKNDKKIVIGNLIAASYAFDSVRRRSCISEWGFILSRETLSNDIIVDAIKYFKKLKKDIVNNNLSYSAYLYIDRVIEIIGKYKV